MIYRFAAEALLLALLGLTCQGCARYLPSCEADCAGKACGDDDGCEGRCTSCPAGQTCSTATWTCQRSCAPSCSGRQCGDDDGCGGRCTTCPTGQTCSTTTWTCQSSCVPSCENKTCGDDDGCGGRCTSCPTGQTCSTTTWTCQSSCVPSCENKACGDDDGCGGRCTTCPTGQTCRATLWKCCLADCACGGSDGCGGVCTKCPTGQVCNTKAGQCTVACGGTTHGLVGYWPANGTTLDASGFGNDGKLSSTSGTVQYAPGHSGNAFAFSNQGWVEVPDDPILDPASALTLAVWVRPDTLTGADILGKDGECKNRQYVLSIGSSSLRLRGHVGTASGFNNTDGKSSLQAGVWTHLAMTYDSITGELVLYVNGAVDGTLAVPAGSRCIVSTPEPLRIGGGATCGTLYPFPGRVDEARVYDRALSAAEIAALAK